MNRTDLRRLLLAGAFLVAAVLTTSRAVSSGGGVSFAPLSTVPVPQMVGSQIVDRAAAVRLGKALFWDVQSGGDGQLACATCHYAAGTDSRRMNVIHPGPDGVFSAGNVTGPGQLYNGASITTDDRFGSQGMVCATFVGINRDPRVAEDVCAPDLTTPFVANRRVTGRNSPSVVGAIFNRDNFWDGRANHVFNGQNPFGSGTAGGAASASATHESGKGGGKGGKGKQILNASLASASVVLGGSAGSQAVGPPNNGVEMSCAGRTFNGPNSLGAKLLARPALQFQLVDATDGVLGMLSAAPANGLRCGNHPCGYPELIAAAFGPAIAADAVNQFSSIFGQAIQAYEATLVPDHTPLDRFLSGNATALTDRQKKGFGVFTGKGQCATCHAGPELTDASLSFAAARGLVNEDGGDQGFHNTGVRPTGDDLGRAGLGPDGQPFSVSRAAADHGAFKTPGLRNVKLTGPYFHNGGKATLDEVVDFYSRGGDFPNAEKAKRIQALGFGADEKAALVDFLANGLTDCRTELQRAPFDHPSLKVPNGPTLPAIGQAGTGACP